MLQTEPDRRYISFMTRKTLLIVAHAPSPNTKALFDAAVAAARRCDVEVDARSPFETTPEIALAADGYLLGTTENLGYMSGALKDFFDRCYYPCLEACQGRPYGVWIRAGQDGEGTRRAIETIVTGLRWRAVADPVICRGPWDPGFVEPVAELAEGLAAGLEAGIF